MLNSAIRIDLGVMPQIENPEAFEELRVMYRCIRQLHIEASANLEPLPTSVSELTTEDLLGLYKLNEKARIAAVAESAILIGEPLVCRYAGDQLLVRTITSFSADPFIGIAANSCGIGDLAVVYTEPSAIGGFAGLTPGERCYMTASKTMTTTLASSVNNLIVGVALTDSVVLLKAFYFGGI